MPRGRAEQLPDDLDTNEVVERIRLRFKAAGDLDLELFPAPEELSRVRTYIREHAHILRREVERAKANLDQLKKSRAPAPVRQEAQERLERASKVWVDTCKDRLTLVRRERQLLDEDEDAGIDAARWGRKAGMGRDSWMTWETLAEVLGLESANGAERRSYRLKLARETKWRVRTPQIAKEDEQRERAQRQRGVDAFTRVRQAASELLIHRDKFAADESIDDLWKWWNDLARFLRIAETRELTEIEKSSTRVHFQVVVDDLRIQPLPSPPVRTDLSEADQAAALKALTAASKVRKSLD